MKVIIHQALWRFLQEALHYVVKYIGTGKVKVVLNMKDGKANLIVEANGNGLQKEKIHQGV